MLRAMFVLSLHIEDRFLQIALLCKQGPSITVNFLRSLEIDTELKDVKLFDILKSHLLGKDIIVVTGLDTSELMFRRLNLKISKHSALFKTLPFQLESLLPYPLQEAVVLPFFHKFSKEKTLVEFYTTKHSYLEQHLSKMAIWEVDPDIISSMPSALKALSSYLYPDHPSLFVYHLGFKKSTYLLIQDKQLILCQSHAFGLCDFLEAFSQDCQEKKLSSEDPIELPFPSLSSEFEKDYPHLFASLQQFKQESQRISSFLKKKNDQESLPPFILYGFLSSHSFLQHFIEESFSPSFHVLSAKPKHEIPLDFAPSIGLALNVLSKEKVQFRQGAFTPSKRKQKLKQATLSYLTSCGLLFLILCVCGFSLIFKKEKQLKEFFSECLVQEGLKSPSFDDTEPLSVLIYDWEDRVNQTKRPFPFLPTMPNVSDVLAWLSSHPHLNKDKSIEVTKVEYKLHKYPRLSESMEAYQAKVDLEFRTASLEAAEQFHQALLQGDSMVNAQKEISWSQQQSIYRASFSLKGKSQ